MKDWLIGESTYNGFSACPKRYSAELYFHTHVYFNSRPLDSPLTKIILSKEERSRASETQ